MQRRNFNHAGASLLSLLVLAIYRQAYALSLGDLTQAEAGTGLKTALEKGALTANSTAGQARWIPGQSESSHRAARLP